MKPTIANADLRESDLPAPNADLWGAVSPFARTFYWPDYYEDHHAMIQDGSSCIEAYRRGQLGEMPLLTLRARLFFEFRVIHWQVTGGPLPTADQLAFIHALVEAIRDKVKVEQHD